MPWVGSFGANAPLRRGGYTPSHMRPPALALESNEAFSCLSWSARSCSDPLQELKQAYRSLRSTLLERNLTVLQERIYIAAHSLDDVLSVRREVFDQPGSPALPQPTILTNRPCLDVPCAGFQCIAARGGGDARVTPVGNHTGGPGQVLEWDGGRALFLASSDGPGSQSLDSMFTTCLGRLNSNGFALRDVARTWLYVADLLGTYDELNRVRDRVFTEAGLGTPGSFEVPPASTGIQGFHPDGRACFMESLAVQHTSGVRPFSPVQPELQCEAWDYGSSFSRGMQIDMANSGLTTLSGTASIGPGGATLHVGQGEPQIRRTVENLENLLEACGKAPRPRGLWTLYFKDDATWQAWQDATSSGRITPIEGPSVFADVCRDDLLFEAELTLPT